MRSGVIFLFLTILVSCSEEVNGFSKPADLIPRDTMVLLLKDLTLIEAHVQNTYNSVEEYRETMLLSGNEVLKQYKISRDRLDRSMDYYGSRQNILSGIYSEILDSLNRDASMFNPAELNTGDSLSVAGGGLNKGSLFRKFGK